ncbi:MAG: ESPR domain-containing protein, partial [Burkholderiaceae bacterium]|nr:ESPR domain-containing protein [Burkholderiaceae bacterium]
MNCIYRSLWNETTGTFVAVAENTRSGGKKTSSGSTAAAGGVLKALVVALAIGFGAQVAALPQGGVVAAGAASISTTAQQTTITQTTPKAAINWQSFNIG